MKFRVSVSKIEVYRKCPRMYKYKYIDELDKKFVVGRPYLSLGNSIHKTLHDFFLLPVEGRTLEKLKSLLDENWIGEGFVDSEEEREYKLRALDMLVKFYNSADLSINPIHLEKWFEIEYPDFTLVGKIDRIDRLPSGGIEIIDYKTGRYVMSEEELLDDLQASVYIMGWEKYANVLPEKMSFYYLNSGEIRTTYRSEEDLEKINEEIKKWVGTIRNDRYFLPTPHPVWCFHCDFNIICPAAGLHRSFKGTEKEKMKILLSKSENTNINSYNLLKAQEQLAGILDLEKLSDAIINVFRELSEADKGILLINDDSKLRIKGSFGFSEKELNSFVFNIDSSIVAWVLNNRKEVFISNKRHFERYSDFIKNFPEFNSMLVFPFITRDRIVGMIILIKTKSSFTDKDLIYLGSLSNFTSQTIDSAIHYSLAIRDDLTRLYIRRYFLQRLLEEKIRAERYKSGFVLIIFDLDHFKKINDTYGHPVGDVVLKFFSKILRDNMRGIDIPCRWGGEEFAVLLPETDITGGKIVAERIRKEVEKSEISIGNLKIKITVSGGLTSFPPFINKVEDLIENADKALYRAKEQGRNRILIYNGD